VKARPEAVRLRRSLLFIPGAEPRKLEKARDSGADTVIFDLEDSVSPEAKPAARDNVVGALRFGTHGEAEPAVRVNAPGTEHFEADLEAVVAAGARAVVLPKAESADAIERVARRLAELEQNLRLDDGTVRILALVESARGIAAASALGAAARVDALCFGHADFALDMGLAAADASTGVVHHARCALAIAAKASAVAPIDCVCLAVRDQEVMRADAELGLRLGFEGKLCIHPAQVRIVNQVYTPSAAEVEHAERVVEGWRLAQIEGRGVFALDGKMIDAPLVRVQQRVIERARRRG
jgi:citrate lyase beta subunit